MGAVLANLRGGLIMLINSSQPPQRQRGPWTVVLPSLLTGVIASLWFVAGESPQQSVLYIIRPYILGAGIVVCGATIMRAWWIAKDDLLDWGWVIMAWGFVGFTASRIATTLIIDGALDPVRTGILFGIGAVSAIVGLAKTYKVRR